jgi:hypothetical protein
MHIKELVGLSEAVPRTVVLPIHIHSTAVRLNRCVRVFHLYVFVAHECPSGEVRSIELRSAPKVPNGLLVFRPQ